jgi:hypothetical protein
MILSGWKEIARYFDCSVRTVQRWEVEALLPIIRVSAGPKSSVLAHSEELQAWLEARGRRNRENSEPTVLLERHQQEVKSLRTNLQTMRNLLERICQTRSFFTNPALFPNLLPRDGVAALTQEPLPQVEAAGPGMKEN